MEASFLLHCRCRSRLVRLGRGVFTEGSKEAEELIDYSSDPSDKVIAFTVPTVAVSNSLMGNQGVLVSSQDGSLVVQP